MNKHGICQALLPMPLSLGPRRPSKDSWIGRHRQQSAAGSIARLPSAAGRYL